MNPSLRDREMCGTGLKLSDRDEGMKRTLAVGQHRVYALLVGFGKNRSLTEISAALRRFLGQQMRAEGLASFKLSGLARLESFSGAFSRLHFRHRVLYPQHRNIPCISTAYARLHPQRKRNMLRFELARNPLIS